MSKKLQDLKAETESYIIAKTSCWHQYEEMNFLYEINLAKDLLKSKRSVATWQPSHDNWSMLESSFKQIKLSQSLEITVNCTPQSNPAPAIAYGKRVNCFEVTAGSGRYLLHSEWKGKFAYWEKLYSRSCIPPKGTVSFNTDRPRPVNNIFIFF